MMDLKLKIEPIPESLWGKALSNFYRNSPKWQAIKAYIKFKEGNRCWICGWTGKLEAHEFFSYNLETRTQKLEAIHHLCFLCHAAIHMGRTHNMFEAFPDKIKEIYKHFCKVNNVPTIALELHLMEAVEVSRKRNSIEDWKQDFGLYNPEFLDKVWNLSK